MEPTRSALHHEASWTTKIANFFGLARDASGAVILGPLGCVPDPCSEEACSDHGTCISREGDLTCACDNGFVNDGPLECVPFCVPGCFNEKTLRACLPKGEEYILDCPEGMTCEGGRCRGEDVMCQGKTAAIIVTDDFDPESTCSDDPENQRHQIEGVACEEEEDRALNALPAVCVEDGGLHMASGKATNFTMAIHPWSSASFYLLECKLRFARNNATYDALNVSIHAGTETSTSFTAKEPDIRQCDFQRIARFASLVGRTADRLKIGIAAPAEQNGVRYIGETRPSLFITECRIWSGTCE